MRNNSLGIFTATHGFPVGSRPITRCLRNFLNKIASFQIQRLICQIVRQYPASKWNGLVSNIAFESFPSEKRGLLHSYNSLKLKTAEKGDFQVLHGFSNQLDQLAHDLGESSGLVWNGRSVFKVSELRWLDSLFFLYVNYVDLIQERLSQLDISVPVLTLTQHSFPERVALKLAKKGGHPTKVITSGLNNYLLSFFQKSEDIAKRKLAYHNMVYDWLTYSEKKKKLSQRTPKTKRRILFVGYKDRTLRRLEHLLPLLLKDVSAEFWILGGLKGYEKNADSTCWRIAELGGNVIWATDFFSKTEIRKLSKDINIRVRHHIESFINKLPSLTYRGVELREEVLPFLKKVALEGSAPSAIYSELASRACDLVNPDLVINFEEWEINRSITLECKKRGIKTLAYYTFSPAAYCDLVPRSQDYFAAPGTFLANAFQKNWSEEKIRVIGDPFANSIATIDRKAARNNLIKKYSFNSAQPILLVLTIYSDDLITEEMLSHFYKKCVLLSKTLQMQVIIKAHPQQNPKEVEASFKSAGLNYPIIEHQADLMMLAAGSDIATTFATSATGQVIMAGTPVVSFQPKHLQEQLEEVYQYRSGGIPVLDFEQDPVPIFKKILSDSVFQTEHVKKAREYVVQHVGPLDGLAHQRFSNYLNDLCR